MINNASRNNPRFQLPEPGIFQANGPDDPLPYYYKPLVGSIYRARIEQALSLLDPPYESILELGYGSGILLPSLCALGTSVSGVDLQSDPEQVGLCLDKVGVTCTLIQGDAADVRFREQSFDLVVAISIFEHISDLTPLLKQIHRLLSPSGRLLVGMPRVDHMMTRAFSLIGFDDIDNHHVTDYKTCRRAAAGHFELIATNHIPAIAPEVLGLYFNMLFQKKLLAEPDKWSLAETPGGNYSDLCPLPSVLCYG
ncbi:MAG TPA: class I SAM-dependent methyltransferase [Desulfobulbus sp.]|nr:class I SAM-dependent methyltransferase [Desulfobulbus sp.]